MVTFQIAVPVTEADMPLILSLLQPVDKHAGHAYFLNGKSRTYPPTLQAETGK